jgi:hypothetical protein
MDMKLEVVVLPVTDVDRSADFYKAHAGGAARVPGRVTSALAVYDSVAGLAQALRRAEAAHGKHEEEIGQPDPDWPDWYAQYMVNDSARQDAQA